MPWWWARAWGFGDGSRKKRLGPLELKGEDAVYYIDGAIRRLSREVGADACWLAPVPPREIPKQMEELRRRRQASSSEGNNGSQEHPPQG